MKVDYNVYEETNGEDETQMSTVNDTDKQHLMCPHRMKGGIRS